jgi:hypothetical protein
MHLALAAFTIHTGGVIAFLAFAAVLGSVLAYTGTSGGAMDQNLGTFGPYVDQELSLTPLTGGGAITQTHGTVVLTDAGVGAYTLPTPVAGLPSAATPGNDGQKLRIIDGSGHAHTVTTSANKINGNKHVATSAGNVGDEITLTAYNGQYLTNPAVTGFALT